IPPARFSDLLAYSTDMGQPLRGKAMRSGDLWFLRSEASAEKVQVSLFVNGIAIEHKGKEVRACFSPFTLVRNCKFQDSSSINQLSSLKIFKIFFFVKNLCYFFGVSADDEAQADKDRQLWVSSIAKAVHLVTQSLFPPFSISCEPICAAAVTSRRLMAGYVLYHSGEDVATVLYGELSPHTRGSDLARLAFYENEQCQRLAMEIWISVASNCFEKVGMSCTCFCINGHDFSARTTAERKLWPPPPRGKTWLTTGRPSRSKCGPWRTAWRAVGQWIRCCSASSGPGRRSPAFRGRPRMAPAAHRFRVR
ncbi:unnamed protein product, partial [Effrenium voratum]